ncbi:MAG: type II secretion system GspH family protein [Gammaproteobacteria bacterium]|nr:type II secretion system GspH family protein [Gammaproteobacteria bacterium]MDH5693671.1 type II secretion system GspH family protein [Gammaproteobacteria bacterium]
MNKSLTLFKRRQAGYTLVEIVVVLTVIAVLAAVIGNTTLSGAQSYTASQEVISLNDRLRLAVERLVRESRIVQYNVSAYSITDMSPTRFAFTKADSNQVVFELQGADLLLSYATPAVTNPLLKNVSQFQISYLANDGVTTATGNTDIAFVEFNVAINAGSGVYEQFARSALRVKP